MAFPDHPPVARQRPYGLLKAETILGLLGVIALGLGIWALMFRVGVSRDSISYLHYARILLGREALNTPAGLQTVVSHYPPIYPLYLAVSSLLHVSFLHAAQALNVVCFVATTMLSAGIIWRITRSLFRTTLGGLLVMTQPALVSVHLWMASEPPFVFEVLLVFVSLSFYLFGQQASRKRAALIGLAVGAAVMTRYIGLSFIPAACAVVFFAAHPRRYRDIGLVLVFALAPMICLSLAHRAIGTSPAHREFNFNPLTPQQWAGFVATAANWIADPAVLGKSAGVLASAGALFCVACLSLRHRLTPTARIVMPAVVCYVLTLLTSVVLFDKSTQLDDRLLAPVAILLLLWVLIDTPPLAEVSNRVRRNVYCAACVACIALVLVNGVERSRKTIHTLRTAGLGFDHVVFKHSPLVRACRSIDPKAVIYSNYPEAILLHAGRDALILPGHSKLAEGEAPPNGDELSGVAAMLHGRGYVAYFKFRAGRNSAGVAMTLDEVNAITKLEPVKKTKDGILLRAVD